MNICYVFSNYHLANITGQAGLMMKLISKTKHPNYNISVISNNLESNRFTKNKINYCLIKGLGDFRTYFLNFFSILSYLIQTKPDVIHVNGILMGIYIWLISFFFPSKYFSLVTETTDNINYLFKKLYCLASIKYKYIFVTSDFLKKQLTDIGINKNKIKIIRIGVDNKFIELNYINEEKYDLFYFGDSSKDRGFDYVIKLAQQMERNNFLISIRYQYNDCRAELETAKKLPNVKLIFYPYKESLKSIISQSKLIILPYRWMLIRPPISLLESMGLGKCVITSSMPGITEIGKNNNNCIIMNFNELDKVKKQINILLRSNQERNRLGKSAHETIRKMYSEKEYSKIVDYYAFSKA